LGLKSQKSEANTAQDIVFWQ